MVCGIHKDGAMFRVGKDQEAEAKAIEGAGDMMFTGRKMGGLIDVTDEAPRPRRRIQSIPYRAQV